ncbi:E6 protein [Rusa timorensis papillomavirus 1]|uniref:Protein E6 n=1 Tax=Rusa timorensis papillomavirus 1 TaxID=2847277 RepID=A0A0X9JL94_9PAPI|nr:E6 protein [Rusa timorensis papillomavirus 1]ALX18463.1 E6 protein [Rusa timorensis papillomavirus 1]
MLFFCQIDSYKTKHSPGWVIMSIYNPHSVLLLAERLGVSPEDLLISCRFCCWFMTFEDLMHFDWKGLQLIWRNGNVFGCCRGCSRIVAYEEHQQFCTHELLGADLIDLVKVPLHLIFIRCVQCLKQLSFAEKLDIIARNDKFCCIRGAWRGRCRVCAPR